LPGTLQAFIKNESWRNNVDKIAKQYNFSEEQSASLENEVFLTLLCFSSTKDFVPSIKTECNVDDEVATKISNFINGTIFGAVMKDIKDVWASMSGTNSSSTPIPEQKNKVGDSFEQAILNQAKAMMPAQENKPTQTPSNLPTEPEMKIDTSIPKQYPGKDPYREPAE